MRTIILLIIAGVLAVRLLQRLAARGIFDVPDAEDVQTGKGNNDG